MITLIKAPKKAEITDYDIVIFLAGSIENGKARDWQTNISERLLTKNDSDKKILVVNPRREEWNSEWSNNPKFKHKINEQIQWELNYLTNSSIVFFNFCNDTLSPVTLLELGVTTMKQALENKPKFIIINIEDGYLRKENILMTVDHILKKYPNTHVSVFKNKLEQASEYLNQLIN